MKRFALGFVLSAVACNGVVSEQTTPATPAVSTDLLDEAAASPVPNGSFASVASLCAAVKAPATCTEDAHALEGTKVILASGIREVKAITIDSELAMDTFLVAQSGSAWTAIRSPIVHDMKDDPGCPSIERPLRVVSVTVNQGMVVVVNEAGRYWWNDNEAGDLTLTYARACTVGSACGQAAVISAKVLAAEVEHPDGPLHAHFFATTYSLSNNGAISPAQTYDDATL